MRISLLSILFFIFAAPHHILTAQSETAEFPSLSEAARISLITGQPGKELYASFGHSAIRVYDPSQGIDLVYNYGTFDFDAPGFYMNFLRGKLNYSLSVYDFRYMILSYKQRNLSLYEQILDLSYEEKKSAFTYLNTNYKPENRFYLYDFFFDNCSSRIRDVFGEILGSKLLFNDEHISNHKTFRQLLDEFLIDSPWADFGIDLILGMPTDALATSDEYMFLPYKLFDAFENARIREVQGRKSFVMNTMVLHQSVDIPEHSSFEVTPKYLFWTVFVLVVVLSLTLRPGSPIISMVDVTLFSVIGLSGTLIAFLWFGTDHTATRDNLNLLWAFPGHLILGYFIIKQSRLKWIKYYSLFWVFFLILFLFSWEMLPQQLNLVNIPIILTLTIRFYYNYKASRNHVESSK